MARERGFSVVVASDGSATARAALAAAVLFPWPAGSRVHGVVARARPAAAAELPETVWAAIEQGFARVAAGTRRMLARRWPDAEVAVVDLPPVEAILAHAQKVGAGAIVIGSRGHGVVGRLLLGSVSRAVVRRADRPVLVVKRRPRSMTRFVVGLDGSANARRAVSFLAGLAAPRGGQVTVLRVVEPVRLPSTALMPGLVRATLNQQVARLNAERMAPARREVEEAAAELQRAGWSVRKLVRSGTPLEELLAVARTARADCLVVGARGVGGVERLLLGSVAMGALDRATIPVLIVR